MNRLCCCGEASGGVMAASYTATAKRAMCGVSASLNSRSATAAFHPPHTTPSPASKNITNTIVLLNEQLA